MRALDEKLKDVPFLIMAHRGFWGGNIIENSIESTYLAFQAGADIVEIDVCQSQEGYYLFHDGEEQKLLGLNKPFQQWTKKEIKETELLNSIKGKSGKFLISLEEFLEWLPKDYFINIDRSWNYFNDPIFWDIIFNSKKIDQLIFKSPVKEDWLDHFNKHTENAYYMPIVKDTEEIEMVKKFSNINIYAVEVIIKNSDSSTYNQQWLRQLKSEYRLLFNAEFLSSKNHLFLGLSDDDSLIGNGRPHAWQKMQEMGADIIQTDWPNFLKQYREGL